MNDFFDDIIEEENKKPDKTKIKKAKKVNDSSEYKRDKNEIQDSVEELKSNISSMLEQIDIPIESLYPDRDLLPGLNLDIEQHDYEKDIQLIKIESNQTLECLANLYLDENVMKNKNVYKIIRDDGEQLAKLNFSVMCSQRALVLCMKQLDFGVNDPMMFQSVAMFQKEMRDTIEKLYSLQKKMKDFYKELKSELSEINAGEQKVDIKEVDDLTLISDPKFLNDMFNKFKKDPKFSENFKTKED